MKEWIKFAIILGTILSFGAVSLSKLTNIGRAIDDMMDWQVIPHKHSKYTF